jgi:hypothetical protein
MTETISDLKTAIAASLVHLERLAVQTGDLQLHRLAVARRHALSRLGSSLGRPGHTPMPADMVAAEWHLQKRLAAYGRRMEKADPLRKVIDDIQCQVAEAALVLTSRSE